MSAYDRDARPEAAAPEGSASPGPSQGISLDEARLRRRMVQRKRAAAATSAPAGGAVQETADRGVQGSGGPLPHLETIQRSFGGHDVSGVTAHTGGRAAEAAQAIGAEAYATGNAVAFQGTPDLHTAAHEAAHVVQQRGGVQLKGGVGEEGDAYERHADAVADRVVAGRSAVDVLDSMAGPASAGGGQKTAVQRRVKVAGSVVANADDIWADLLTRDPLKVLDQKQQAAAKKVLVGWIAAAPKSSNPLATSEDREYERREHLARALAGEVRSSDNLTRETGLAQGVIATESINGHVGAFLTRLAAWNAQHESKRGAANNTKARYAYYYTSFFTMATKGMNSIGTALASPPGDLNGRITLAADYAVSLRKVGGADEKWEGDMPADLDAARKTHWNPNESADWTKEARGNDAPLSAGPSATTAQLLALATKVGATKDEKIALAWGIFAFFNQGLNLHQSGTHRFHEVMAVAAGYGVPYTPWQYGEIPELTLPG